MVALAVLKKQHFLHLVTSLLEHLSAWNYSNILSGAVDVDGFGVDGADGVDVPDVEAVADVVGVWGPSFMPLPPLRP